MARSHGALEHLGSTKQMEGKSQQSPKIETSIQEECEGWWLPGGQFLAMAFIFLSSISYTQTYMESFVAHAWEQVPLTSWRFCMQPFSQTFPVSQWSNTEAGKVWERTIVELDSYDFTVSETRVRYKGWAGDCF